MKTIEQITQETISYLEKTSKHTFIKPKSKLVYSNGLGHYEYDYTNTTLYKIYLNGNEVKILEDGKTTSMNLNDLFNYHGKNAKCVLKGRLFGNLKVKSIRNTKDIKQKLIGV